MYNALVAVLLAAACQPGQNKEETQAEKEKRDSVSKVQQRQHSDSLKRLNPLLIMPPDSNYTGSYIDRYPNGIVKFRGFFRFGERHGQWMSFYPTGLLWSEMHYDKGLRHGPNTTYYETGQMRYTGIYKNDRRDSIWVYYDSIGKVAERVRFSDDKIVERIPLK